MARKPLERWHGAHHYSDKIHLLLVAFLFFAVMTFLWSYFTLSSAQLDKNQTPSIVPSITAVLTPTPTISPTQGTLCTQEARLCPDGKTWVGRTGPNCAFSPCPSE